MQYKELKESHENIDDILSSYNLNKSSIKEIDSILPSSKDTTSLFNKTNRKCIDDKKANNVNNELFTLFDNFSKASESGDFEFDKETVIKDLAAQRYVVSERASEQFLRGIQYAINFLLNY